MRCLEEALLHVSAKGNCLGKADPTVDFRPKSNELLKMMQESPSLNETLGELSERSRGLRAETERLNREVESLPKLIVQAKRHPDSSGNAAVHEVSAQARQL